MKKRILLLALLVTLLVVALCACGESCPHEYKMTQPPMGVCGQPRVAIFTCNLCGDTLREQASPLEHSYAETVQTAPSCLEQGLMKYTCTNCSDTYTSPIPATGHSFAPATCLEPEICQGCGETKGSPKGHSWQKATCEEPETCSRCGDLQGTALGHDFRGGNCIEPSTCTKCNTQKIYMGHAYKDFVCTVCHEIDPEGQWSMEEYKQLYQDVTNALDYAYAASSYLYNAYYASNSSSKFQYFDYASQYADKGAKELLDGINLKAIRYNPPIDVEDGHTSLSGALDIGYSYMKKVADASYYGHTANLTISNCSEYIDDAIMYLEGLQGFLLAQGDTF